jgi:hypothetical protein
VSLSNPSKPILLCHSASKIALSLPAVSIVEPSKGLLKSLTSSAGKIASVLQPELQINGIANVISVSGCPAAEFALELAILCHLPVFFLVTKVKEITRQNTQVLTMPFFFTRPFMLHVFFCHLSIPPYPAESFR